jgi:UDP-glucose 4-epimerase/UDP-glucuronate decarboxylase
VSEQALVTGGAGFLGLHLAAALLARGDEVTLADDFSRGRRDAALEALLPRVTLIERDLTGPLDDLAARRFTQIFHFAARVGVERTLREPYAVLRDNLLSTLRVLELATRIGGVAVCFSSSSEVYSGTARCTDLPLPTPEDVPLCVPDLGRPRAAYGLSKLAGEGLCLHAAAAHGLIVRVLRYHNVYGPRMGFDHVIPQLIQRLHSREDPLVVRGAQRRSFTYVADAVEATLRLMALPTPPVLTVHVGDDREETPILDLARRLCDLAGHRPRFVVVPPPDDSPERRLPDLSRLRRLTGFAPSVSLDDGLRRTYAWYRAVLDGREPEC